LRDRRCGKQFLAGSVKKAAALPRGGRLRAKAGKRFGAGKQRTISTSGEGAIVRIRISIIRDFADWVQASRIAAATSSGSNISE